MEPGTGLHNSQWKVRAFRAVIADIKANLGCKRSRLKVLSVGDHNRDGQATFALSANTKEKWYCARQRLLFVKFEEDPSTEDLIQQAPALHTRVDQLPEMVGPINSTIQDLENSIQI